MDILFIVVSSLSGLLLTFVGFSRLSNPIKTYSKNSGIELPSEVNVLNEMRGIAAVMLCAGLLNFFSLAFASLKPTAFTVATLIFLGFALGRIVSMAVDGKPNPKLIQGLLFELGFGGLNVACLVLSVA